MNRPGRAWPDGVREDDGARAVRRVAPMGAAPPYGGVVLDGDAVLVGAPGRERLSAGASDLVRRLRTSGVRVALKVGWRHVDGPWVAELVSLGVVVGDGAVAEAAELTDLPPAQVAVLSGSAVGVRDARSAAVGLVVGIDRNGQRADLEAAGADLVFDDVGEVDLGVMRTDPWVLAYEGFDPAHEGHREALTTLGNGYLGTRGAAPERTADGVHYPGCYLAGIYNRLTSQVQGREVEDEHLVNAPNWLPLDLRIEDGSWWSEGGLSARRERRELDLRTGVLTRRVTLADQAGRRVDLTQRRLVSMARPHMTALETTVVPRGWTGCLAVRSGIDASVRNAGVAEFAQLSDRHLGHVTGRHLEPDVLLVEAVTTTSEVTIATAARTVVTGAAGPVRRRLEALPEGYYGHRLDVLAADERPVLVDKTVAVVTSRDPAIASPGLAALDQLGRSPSGVAGLLDEHEQAWARLWRSFHVDLAAGRDEQLVLNLHLFHLLQCTSPHTAELDAGVTARGLHGEGYRGHVFWDELFVLPLLTLHLPAVARALLDYRWRRLGAARQAAAGAGQVGALFPWQSGSDGREETPAQLFNMKSGRWMPDNSRRQRHVGLAVAHNAWRYYQATDDTAWLVERGAELIIEVTRLFAGLASHDSTHDRFHIGDVMGPDEYHDGYPGAAGGGVRDNAYTNVLVAWVCRRALDTLTVLSGHDCDDLRGRLQVEPEEESRWEHMSRRMAVPFHADGVISQFAGYEELEELDWDRYRATYDNIGRLDLILEAEGDTTNRYKLAKQADVLMLVYVLGADELQFQLGALGYPLAPDVLGRTVDYYLLRTAHGSTLSRVVHASVLASIDPGRAWATFREALVADLDDTQGGTTKEGIHLGAMAGTADIVGRAFAGLRIGPDALVFEPRLPAELRQARFQILFRGQRIDVTLDQARLQLSAHPCVTAAPVNIQVAGTRTTLGGGETLAFDLPAGLSSNGPARPAAGVARGTPET